MEFWCMGNIICSYIWDCKWHIQKASGSKTEEPSALHSAEHSSITCTHNLPAWPLNRDSVKLKPSACTSAIGTWEHSHQGMRKADQCVSLQKPVAIRANLRLFQPGTEPSSTSLGCEDEASVFFLEAIIGNVFFCCSMKVLYNVKWVTSTKLNYIVDFFISVRIVYDYVCLWYGLFLSAFNSISLLRAFILSANPIRFSMLLSNFKTVRFSAAVICHSSVRSTQPSSTPSSASSFNVLMQQSAPGCQYDIIIDYMSGLLTLMH